MQRHHRQTAVGCNLGYNGVMKPFLERLTASWLDLCITAYGGMLNAAQNLTELGKAHHETLKKEVAKDKPKS